MSETWLTQIENVIAQVEQIREGKAACLASKAALDLSQAADSLCDLVLELEAQRQRPRKIGLVACSRTKADHAAPARDLYQGALFRASAAYAEEVCDEWYILSAKHGLVSPDTILEPYDESLYDLSAAERREWGVDILVALGHAGCLSPRYPISWLVLAGKRYRECFVPGLMGEIVEIPLAGMGIGQQIAWMQDVAMEVQSVCRVCQVAAPTYPGGMCVGCMDATNRRRV